MSRLPRKLLLLAVLPLLSTCLKTGPEPICGNAIVEPEERCDCGSGASPPAGCTGPNSDTAPSPCREDCTRAGCGDGIVDPGEACDRDALNGQSCESLGFTGGALTCDATCFVNTDGCI